MPAGSSRQRLDRIATIIAANESLARRHAILTSIDGLGALSANRLLATMPALVAACFNPA